jgi:vacuolar-type H+-ATPase subunit B/Vma2
MVGARNLSEISDVRGAKSTITGVAVFKMPADANDVTVRIPDGHRCA